MKSAIYGILGLGIGLTKDIMINAIKRYFGNTKVGYSEVTHAAPIIYKELNTINESLTIILMALQDVMDENTDVEM